MALDQNVRQQQGLVAGMCEAHRVARGVLAVSA
jgi:hypothetical protein